MKTPKHFGTKIVKRDWNPTLHSTEVQIYQFAKTQYIIIFEKGGENTKVRMSPGPPGLQIIYHKAMTTIKDGILVGAIPVNCLFHILQR